MICLNCHMGEVALHEVTMEKKIFHLSETGVKEQQVDTEKTGITLCHCDYCHTNVPIDLNTNRIKFMEELEAEEILDELGFILP